MGTLMNFDVCVAELRDSADEAGINLDGIGNDVLIEQCVFYAAKNISDFVAVQIADESLDELYLQDIEED